jgi:hypothetical protein
VIIVKYENFTPLKDLATSKMEWAFVSQRAATEQAESDDKPHVSRHLKAGSHDHKAWALLLERNIR